MTLRLQVGMDPKVFDRLQFWEYLNLMEVKQKVLDHVSVGFTTSPDIA
jgi:hypothetical protein